MSGLGQTILSGIEVYQHLSSSAQWHSFTTSPSKNVLVWAMLVADTMPGAHRSWYTMINLGK